MSDIGQVEKNERLAAIVATSDDAIISKDTRGIVKTWNGAAERIFGYSAEEMIGQPLLRIIPKDRFQEETDILAKIQAGDRVDHFQTIRVRKDGREIHVSVTISPIKDADGKVIGASKIARDVTDMVRAQRERERLYELSRFMVGVRDMRQLLQKITDVATELSNAQFGAFFYNVTDSEGESYTLYTISGVPAEHFSKFPMPRNTAVFGPTFKGEGVVRSDDITQDPRYGKNAPYKGMPAGHLPVRSYLAVSVVSPDGDVVGGLFFGHERAGIFTAHDESIVSTIASNASIALENARLHREVSDTASKFRQLANSIPQLAWMATPEGSFFWFNDRWLEYTGLPAAAQYGNGWEQVLHPDESARVIGRWKDAQASKKPWEDTFRIRSHDGVFRWHLSRAVPLIDESEAITYWLGTNTDVTEQRELMSRREELLNAERTARAESERLGQLKDEFLATLSHELRTPLNAILGWSQLLSRGKTDLAMVSEGIGVIERNARVQAQLIEDLLDMSRIVSGKLRLDTQILEPTLVVKRAVDVLRPTAETKDIDLQLLLDKGIGPITGDPNRLQQIIWNLVNNAIKFTPRGGTVRVHLKQAHSHVSLVVSDTGCGIDPAFLPHVFERFRQSDASTTRRFGGLGLGLAIVKQLAELHGGEVGVRSEGLGRGATFTVSLPLAARPPSHDDNSTQLQSSADIRALDDLSLAGIRVLMVDDEADSRELIARILKERGAVVAEASDANSGRSMVASQRPDLIISDIGMPEKDGYEFIREVRDMPADRGGRTTAIALTAFARPEDRARAMLAGFQLHMPKPVDPHELIATVASLGAAARRERMTRADSTSTELFGEPKAAQSPPSPGRV